MNTLTIKLLSTLTGLVLACISSVAFAQSGTGAVLVSVNGIKIYTSQVNEIVGMAVTDGAKDTPELRQNILNEIIIREAVSQDVKKTGLLTKESNPLKLKLAQSITVFEIWFGQYLKTNPITEADIKAEYDRRLATSKEPKNTKQYEVAQITVATEAEAMDLIKQINAGAKFETLAKEKSLDKASGVQGGVVGWVFSYQLTPPLNDIILILDKGKITPNPVKANNAWNIVKLNDVRPFVLPDFDQLKNNIAQELIQQRRNTAINILLKESKIANGS
ncbi:peptidylprolyl isomerase [Polynucleobacter sp. CS-Odin-A6]|uniref:peptidylprolyl isomerase n=1 Tax=Polynucleobacter sp. CS-Odin-A6 TaxID=2689106 RepID=UPI001C0AF6BB|nr:peptidylprolyl isomerase [Polynucleobacter sp. CS-Odin-A6]MBU3621021.1 peptidylprolyl isomerase [Polynucleobacter sp. CS-Odin-A6]